MKRLTILTIVFALSACATSNVVVEQTNQGVQLTSKLKSSLSDYQARTTAIDAARKQILADRKTRVAEFRSLDANIEQLYEFSGMTGQLGLHAQLKALADRRSKAATDDAGAKKAVMALLDGLMKPLPDVSSKLGASQKALADLAAPLSASEQIQIVMSAFAAVKGDAADNAKAADSAASAASAATPAPAQPASPPPPAAASAPAGSASAP